MVSQISIIIQGFLFSMVSDYALRNNLVVCNPHDLNYNKRNSCVDANNCMLLSWQGERHVSLKKDKQQAGFPISRRIWFINAAGQEGRYSLIKTLRTSQRN